MLCWLHDRDDPNAPITWQDMKEWRKMADHKHVDHTPQYMQVGYWQTIGYHADTTAALFALLHTSP